MQALDCRIPNDVQAAEPAYVPIRRTKLNATFGVVAALLSLVSLVVVVQGAGDEPYTAYRRSDAIVQVGVGSALIGLWCCGCLALVVLIGARKLSPAWLPLLLWAAICVFYLGFSTRGYLQDIEKFVIPAASGGGG